MISLRSLGGHGQVVPSFMAVIHHFFKPSRIRIIFVTQRGLFHFLFPVGPAHVQTLGSSLCNYIKEPLVESAYPDLPLSLPTLHTAAGAVFLRLKLDHKALIFTFFSSSNSLQHKMETYTNPITVWTQVFGTRDLHQYL